MWLSLDVLILLRAPHASFRLSRKPPDKVFTPAGSRMTQLGAITLTAVALAAVLTGQERPLVFQAGSELVVLDLIATEDSGCEVSDLTRSESQIVEDASQRPCSAAAADLPQCRAARSRQA